MSSTCNASGIIRLHNKRMPVSYTHLSCLKGINSKCLVPSHVLFNQIYWKSIRCTDVYKRQTVVIAVNDSSEPVAANHIDRRRYMIIT